MKRRNTSKIFYTLIFSITLMFSSCTTVKSYQSSFLKDSEMELNSRGLEEFENGFQSYREGAAGGNGGNIGGGCGCN